MVEFDGYKGPFWEDTRTVPVFLATTRFRHNNHDCERTQFPLVVAYAITIHKSQGMTLEKAVLNIEKKGLPAGAFVCRDIQGYEQGRANVRDNF